MCVHRRVTIRKFTAELIDSSLRCQIWLTAWLVINEVFSQLPNCFSLVCTHACKHVLDCKLSNSATHVCNSSSHAQGLTQLSIQGSCPSAATDCSSLPHVQQPPQLA